MDKLLSILRIVASLIVYSSVVFTFLTILWITLYSKEVGIPNSLFNIPGKIFFYVFSLGLLYTLLVILILGVYITIWFLDLLILDRIKPRKRNFCHKLFASIRRVILKIIVHIAKNSLWYLIAGFTLVSIAVFLFKTSYTLVLLGFSLLISLIFIGLTMEISGLREVVEIQLEKKKININLFPLITAFVFTAIVAIALVIFLSKEGESKKSMAIAIVITYSILIVISFLEGLILYEWRQNEGISEKALGAGIFLIMFVFLSLALLGGKDFLSLPLRIANLGYFEAKV